MSQPPGLYSDITPSKNFYIFGSGISHSISPTIHNAGFRHYNLPFIYEIRESRSIEEVVPLIEDEKFGGASVTMPHKLQVHMFCTEQTETARLIGAINTLVVNHSEGQRSITGDNTDWSGLYSIMNSYAARVKQPRVGLVIGAGGASRAALYAMYRAGCSSIYLVNRTMATAQKVKRDFEGVFEIEVLPSLEDLPQMPDAIIGTVPAETTTEKQFASIFGPRGLCIDMAYKPRQTPLLTVAQNHEQWHTVTGIEVLLAQAYDQFRLWTGQESPRKQMIGEVASREGEQSTLANGGLL